MIGIHDSWNMFSRMNCPRSFSASGSLNPSKISGVCGRLMCCLTFEHATYKKMSKALPRCGKKVRIGSEMGKVTRQNPLEETVLVEMEDGKEVEVGLRDLKKG